MSIGVIYKNGYWFPGTQGTIDFQSLFLNTVYPIGAIYLSVNNVNPSAFLGGEWESYGTSDSYLRLGGDAEGGSNTYTLSANNIPSHTHTIGAHSHGLNSHTHTVGAHSHGLNSHTHSIPALSGTAASSGSHTHYLQFDGYRVDNNYTPTSAGYGQYRALLFNIQNTTTGQQVVTNGSHTHSVTTTASTSGKASGSTANSSSFNSGAASGSTANSTAFDTGAYGATSVTAISIEPKYVQVYAWKRTA